MGDGKGQAFPGVPVCAEQEIAAAGAARGSVLAQRQRVLHLLQNQKPQVHMLGQGAEVNAWGS